MRDQSGGVLFCPPIERKNFSVKRNGREEGSEFARRRPPVHGFESSYENGGAKATASMAQVGMGRAREGSLKASSSNEVRSEEEEDVSMERLSPASRGGTEEGLLPQWGRGKRSRGSRADKHTTSVSPAQECSPPLPIKKKHVSNGISSSDLRSQVTSKAPICKFRPVCRNDLTAKASNGSDQAKSFNSGRKFPNGKERAASLQKGSLDYSGGRQQQRSDRSDLAMTNSAIDCGEKLIRAYRSTNGASILSNVNGLESNRPKFEWPRIALTLSRKEKEEDFLIFKGSKLPQRPRKRLKVVEKAVLFCSPGNWLDDISYGRYDVTEKKSTKKKPRGLKVMDIADLDSE